VRDVDRQPVDQLVSVGDRALPKTMAQRVLNPSSFPYVEGDMEKDVVAPAVEFLAPGWLAAEAATCPGSGRSAR
jgi:hypothetical protein